MFQARPLKPWFKKRCLGGRVWGGGGGGGRRFWFEAWAKKGRTFGCNASYLGLESGGLAGRRLGA